MEEDISGEGGGHSSSDNNEYDESPDLGKMFQ